MSDRELRPEVPGARFVASPNFDSRPKGETVSLLVLHAISLPPGCFGGSAIERLFTNRLDPQEHPYFGALGGLRVSAHFLLGRDGALTQFVRLGNRAWHAGASQWRGRPDCNDFSVGVELEGDQAHRFTFEQYRGLASLVVALCRRLPLRDIVGHQDVAPLRKWDPGHSFAWTRALEATGKQLHRASVL